MQKKLTDKFLSVEEDRKTIGRKLTELHTSVAGDSAILHGLPELTDSKFTSHHKNLNRLVKENIDDFISEVTNYMDERAPANAAFAPASAPAALGPPFQFGPPVPSGLTRSFALAARTPPADVIRMRSPISRTPAVPASVIHSDGSINRKRAAFALSHGQSALCVLDSCGVEALLDNSHLLSEEDSVSEELSTRIQEICHQVIDLFTPCLLTLHSLSVLSVALPDLDPDRSLYLGLTPQM